MKRAACSYTLALAGAALLMFAAGCNRDGVKVYKVDSSDTVTTAPPPVADAPQPPSGLPAPDNAGLPKVTYIVPEGWAEKTPSQMRVASFDVSENGKSADVSVVPLGAMSGSDAANVNRWRGQVGLAAADDGDLKQAAEPVQIAGQPASVYDVAGTNPDNGANDRIIAAILHTDNATWYFKIMGDSALVEKNKTAFLAFLNSVKFGTPVPAAPLTMGASQLPASPPAIPEPAAGDKPTWTVPPDWREGELLQFLVARYVIQGAGDANAAVNVSQLEGDGGGLLPNLNRWGAQIGQAPITDDDVAKLPMLDASGGKAVVADFTGTDPQGGKPVRLVGVVLPLNGRTWFYKLMGDPDLVARQKDAFIAFVQSAKYPAEK